MSDEEHVVEGGMSDAQVVERYAQLLESPSCCEQQGGTARGRYADQPAVDVDARAALLEAGQQRGGAVEVCLAG